jgi:hypothetical protein
MVKASNRAQRFSVMCAVATVVSLGWSPLHVLADDSAIDAVGSSAAGATDQVVEEVTATADPVDAASEGASTQVEAVSTATPDAVQAVSETTSATVDTASGTTDTVSNTASGTVSNVSGATGDTTAGVGGAAGNVTSGVLNGAGQAGVTTAATGSTSLPLFSSQQAAADRRSTGAMPRSIHDDLVLLAERGRAPATFDTQGPGPCISSGSAFCETTAGEDAPGSFEGSVASIIQKLLALTGSGLLNWIAASCILTVMGALALQETKKRSRGEGYPLGSG